MNNTALLGWYRNNARTLPWRGSTDPWTILVSEVMAQQTQLSRVVPAFEPFMERFPTPNDLAESGVAELLRLWDGLGYQRRALNLQRAAAVIVDEGWPETASELERLPGVGPYTAAAVACFAFGHTVPAIDTNLRRVISRWEGKELTVKQLRSRAEAMIDRVYPAEWNQAIMDLAATLCRPRNPRCDECPVASACSDPTVYVSPPPQSRYRGSVRQARAAIVKRLASGATTIEDLRGIPAGEHLDPALAALQKEGVVNRHGEQVELVG